MDGVHGVSISLSPRALCFFCYYGALKQEFILMKHMVHFVYQHQCHNSYTRLSTNRRTILSLRLLTCYWSCVSLIGEKTHRNSKNGMMQMSFMLPSKRSHIAFLLLDQWAHLSTGGRCCQTFAIFNAWMRKADLKNTFKRQLIIWNGCGCFFNAIVNDYHPPRNIFIYARVIVAACVHSAPHNLALSLWRKKNCEQTHCALSMRPVSLKEQKALQWHETTTVQCHHSVELQTERLPTHSCSTHTAAVADNRGKMGPARGSSRSTERSWSVGGWVCWDDNRDWPSPLFLFCFFCTGLWFTSESWRTHVCLCVCQDWETVTGLCVWTELVICSNPNCFSNLSIFSFFPPEAVGSASAKEQQLKDWQQMKMMTWQRLYRRGELCPLAVLNMS